jgi:predicted RNA-binding protein with PIN domain
MQKYWVDAYNLLFRQPSFQQGSLRQQRENLIEHLNDKIAVAGWDVTLIFDAVSQYGLARRSHHEFLGIVFTGEGISADEHIVEELGQRSDVKNIVVVTSDKHLAWRARHQGAQTESVGSFMKRLNKRIRKKSPPKSPGPPPPAEPKEAEEAGRVDHPDPHSIYAQQENPDPKASPAECYNYYLQEFEKRMHKGEDPLD